MYHLSKRISSLVLALVIVLSLLPVSALAAEDALPELPLGDEVTLPVPEPDGGGTSVDDPIADPPAELSATLVQYIEITGQDALVEGDYVIFANGRNLHNGTVSNGVGATNHCALPVPTEATETSPSTIDLAHKDLANGWKPADHVWHIAPSGSGFTIQGTTTGKELYLTHEASGSQLALKGTAEAFTITPNGTTGYYITYGTTNYLRWTTNGWNFSTATNNVRLFKKTETQVTFTPPTIQGYTLVPNIPDGGLHQNTYYLIVGQASNGNLYALKPDASSTATGGAGAHPECTVALTVDGTTHAATPASGAMADLHFALSRTGLGRYAFYHEATNGSKTYLCLNANGTDRMFVTDPVDDKNVPHIPYLTVQMNSDVQENCFAIGNQTEGITNRWLSLFVPGDPGSGEFSITTTGWWGPGGTQNLPVYLYQYTGEGPTPTLGSNISLMFDARSAYAGANSWVFTGGRAVQGSYQDNGGARNFIGQFEEYIRSTKENGVFVGRQRHTISTAYEGQTLQDIVDTFATRIADSANNDAPLKPRAVAYMVGPEDYAAGTAGINTFKTNLKALIQKSLALREGNGFAVIQTPYATNNATTNTTIEAYVAAVNEVVQDADFAGRIGYIVVVDHYAQTKDNAEFKATLNADGYPNGKGHLELGRQLAEATIKTTENFPAGGQAAPASDFPNKATVAVPTYQDAALTVTSAGGSVTAGGLPTGSWNYTLEVSGSVGTKYTVEGTASGTLTVSGLTAGDGAVLSLTKQDGSAALPKYKGTVNGSFAKYTQDTPLAAIQAKIDAKGDAGLTWLFMGDSITHAAMWTHGYDGIAQAFEKYLKDDLGRAKDIVINTAVSGANTVMTHQSRDNRLLKYSPDVVSVMLGTNDAVGVTIEEYKGHLEELVTEVTNPKDDTENPGLGAVLIFRTPTPCTPSGRGNRIILYVEAMRQVAAANPDKVILIDQFAQWKPLMMLGEDTSITASAIYGSYIRDDGSMNIHPDEAGHLWMTRQFIEELGLWKDNSSVYQLDFATTAPTAVTSDIKPGLTWDKDERTVTLSLADLSTAYGHVLTEATLQLTAGDVSYSAHAVQGGSAVITGIPGTGTSFTVTVTAQQGDQNNQVTFTRTLNLNAEAELTGPVNITGYTRLTELPQSGELELGNYIFVNAHPTSSGTDYYMLYPGATGAGNTANNAAKLVLEDNLATGYRTKAAGYDNGTVSTDWAAANNLLMRNARATITYSGTDYPSYSVTAKNGSATYHLFQGGNGVYHSEGPSETFFVPQGDGTFALRNNNNNHACLFFFEGTNGANMNFNQQGTANNLDKFLIFKSNTPPAVPIAELRTLIATAEGKTQSDYTSSSWARLASALQAAKTVEANSSTDYLAVTNAMKALQTAVAGLRERPQYQEVPSTATKKELDQLKPAPKTGLSQPFPSLDGVIGGAAGNDSYRIPSLTTIKGGAHAGRLVAATDIRWRSYLDSSNIDTAVSYSDDGGKTWNTSIVNYFGDSSNPATDNRTAIFIDPMLTADNSGNLFLVVNAFPAGTCTHGSRNQDLAQSTGFVNVTLHDGTQVEGQRMAIYTDYVTSTQTDSNYSYYLDVFGDDGYADILDAYDGSASGYYADRFFYLYYQKGAQKAPATDKIYCAQLDDANTWVQQNLFFQNATLHVRTAQFIYVRKSTDGGVTWSDPIILNPQMRTSNESFYGPGPGAGICLADGTLIVPMYDNGGGEHATCMYSTDGGNTWTRATRLNFGSESCIVPIDATTLRQFYRDNTTTIHYNDRTLQESGDWLPGDQQSAPGAPKQGNNQLSALRYASQVDGKDIIFVSTATSPGVNAGYKRQGGKIYAFELKSDKTMALLSTYQINNATDWYGYSTLTQLSNGAVGLIYENSQTDGNDDKRLDYNGLTYVTLPINSLVYGGTLSNLVITAEAMEQEGHTVSSWNALQTAIADAKTVLAKVGNTRSELEAAQQTLQTAIDTLQEIPVVPTVPTSTIYTRDKDGINEGVYAIYSEDANTSQQRILYDPNADDHKTNHVMADNVTEDALVLCSTGSIAANGQLWEVKAVTNGYSFKNLASGRYLDLTQTSTSGVDTSATPVALTVTKSGNSYTIVKGSNKLGKDGNAFISTTGAAVSMRLYEQKTVTVVPKTNEELIPQGGPMGGQPFPTTINYRIPAIATLTRCTYGEAGGHTVDHKGRLVAAVDARWNHTADARNIDTLFSYSDDNGKTWHYSFPIYFGDSVDSLNARSTTLMDPVLIQGEDGLLYLMVDAFPGGTALGGGAPQQPHASNGYVTINGKQRMVLYTSPEKSAQTTDNYLYYVGDFVDGYATIYDRADTDSGFYVDDHYYLYQKKAAQADPETDKIYCQQIGSNEWIQQNVFFWNASLHVQVAQYLWLVTSEDGGVTWSAPNILNPMVHPGNGVFFCGPGPGGGLALDDGTVILPIYTASDLGASQRAGFIYTTDHGVTWHRAPAATSNTMSSENFLVQIDANTVRCFYREGTSAAKVPDIHYTDYTRGADGAWTPGARQTAPTAAKKDGTGTQISGIRYSKTTADGRTILILSTPGPNSRRKDGRIYVFAVNNDANRTMELLNTFAIDNPVTTGADQYFCYSSVTELSDGTIGLLYENDWTGTDGTPPSMGQVKYVNIPFYPAIPEDAFRAEVFLYDGNAHTIQPVNDSHLTVTYSTEENGDYSSTLPTFIDPGKYTIWYKVAADNALLGNVPVQGSTTVTITDQIITPELTLTCSEPPAGGGIVTITLTGAPSEGSVTVSCDNSGISVTDHGDGIFSADLPNATATYIFTATYTAAAGSAYQDATATCSVSVTKNNGGSTGGSTTGGSNNNSSTPSETTTIETKGDGTKVTTVTKPDGTTTTTTEAPDGTTEVVEAKKDGTVTATTESPDGTVAVVETKPDGSKTQTVEHSDGTKSELTATKDGDVTITVTDPEGEEIVKTELPAKLPEPELTFEDVPETHWAQEAIKHMVGLGLAQGVGGNQYDAAVPMTRGSLATVLHRLSQGKTDYEVTFQDVAETKFYAPGVAWAAKAGVVTGYTADIFAPEDVITREQLAVMLARYAKLIGMNTKADAKALDKFNDGQNTGAWAVDGMAWCVENGIIRGKDGNRLDPTTNVSRAEVAMMLDRFIELLK